MVENGKKIVTDMLSDGEQLFVMFVHGMSAFNPLALKGKTKKEIVNAWLKVMWPAFEMKVGDGCIFPKLPGEEDNQLDIILMPEWVLRFLNGFYCGGYDRTHYSVIAHQMWEYQNS
jgi:hypothetical protein